RASLQVVVEDRGNRPKAVLTLELLPLGVSASAVRDPLFVNSTARAGEFGNNFRLNAKPIFFYLNRFDKWGLEGFVPCFHVGQIDIGQHVGEQRQKFVSHHVPKEKNTMWPPAHETGAKNR